MVGYLDDVATGLVAHLRRRWDVRQYEQRVGIGGAEFVHGRTARDERIECRHVGYESVHRCQWGWRFRRRSRHVMLSGMGAAGNRDGCGTEEKPMARPLHAALRRRAALRAATESAARRRCARAG